MSAIQGNEIMGISARYAAQIRNLLATQALQRTAVQQQAARADAETRQPPPQTPRSGSGVSEAGYGLATADKPRPAPEARARDAQGLASMDLAIGNGPSEVFKKPIVDLKV
ncbi:MAG: hypothetical protein KGS00_06020 [Alphaproteobacteria bacterium]|nr:hypothetical protein [Alphaproteobacteria bacterium]